MGRFALFGVGLVGVVACRGRTPEYDPCARAVAEHRANAADVCDALGDSQLNNGDAEASIASYRRALAHRPAADLRGRTLDARGLYRASSMINDYETAMSNAALAYEWSAKLDDKELRGRVLVGVIALLYDIGDLPAAEAVLPEASEIVDPNTLVGLKLREARSLIDLAHGRARLAARGLGEVQALARAQGDAFLAEVTADLIDAQLDAGDLDGADRALASYPAGQRASGESRQWYAHVSARLAVARGRNEEAVALASAALNDAPPDWIAELEAIRGHALWRAGHVPEAEKSLLAAIDSIEQRRARTALDTLKTWVIDQQREPFEDLFRLYVDQKRVVDALAIVQRATARSVLDGISQKPSPGSSIAQQIDRAGDRAAGLLALAHSLSASRAVMPPDGPTLVTQLAGRYVVTYFRAGGDVWLLALRPGGPPSARRLGTVEELRPKIDAWLADPERGDVGEELARLLLPEDLRPGPGITVYVAADEPVRDVSFAALPIDGTYLVRRNPVAYVPAASTPAAARSAITSGPVIVLGDPSGDLPAARREALEVAHALRAEASVGAEATRARVAARGARLLHVAGHTALTPRGPALVLADGRIDSGEILDHRFAADVVVLTSCAAADPRDRDELAPLANAFLAAGAGTVVASRWSVEDDIALRFTRAFYAAGGANDPVTATAEAQRHFIADKVAVREWATFVALEAPRK